MSIEEFPIECFLEQVKKYPNEIALFINFNNSKHEEITYEELNKKTDQLAFYLTKEYKPKNIIAINLPQGHLYIIYMLAIWKSGMVYMPLYEDSLESDEVNQIDINCRLEKTQANLIDSLWHDKFEKNLKSSQYLPDLHYIKPKLSLDDTAFIMSSSGSGGNPKIIKITFEALMKRIHDHQERMEISRKNKDCMLGILNYAWDASIMETLSALTAGIPIFVAPEEIRKNLSCLPDMFNYTHKKNISITTAIFIPSILKDFNPIQFPGLKKFLSTGEAFNDLEKLNQWFDANIKIFNGYGPTETTFGVSIIELSRNNELPIFNLDFGLFTGISAFRLKYNSETKRWVSAGNNEKAELFIGGQGLGEYFYNDELNQKYFIATKEIDEELGKKLDNITKLYRTYDIVNLKDKNVFFCYRNDRIVKRSGKQINLDAIEKSLKSEYGFAIVIFHNNLVKAFICKTDDMKIKHKDINLYYEFEDTSFLSGTQKTRKKFDTLIKHSKKIIVKKSCEYTETEKEISLIFESFIEPDLFLPKDCDFKYDLGGDSLLLMQMISKVWQMIKNKEQNAVPHEFSAYIWKNRTIEKIAMFVDIYKTEYLEKDEKEVFSIKKGIIIDRINNEIFVISLIRQIHQWQATGPYIIDCSDSIYDEIYHKFCGKLSETETVFYTKYKNKIDDLIHKKIKFRLIEKIKKSQETILQENLPEYENKSLSIDKAVLWVMGDILTGKTFLLKQTLINLWEKFDIDNSQSMLPIYFSLRGEKQTAVYDFLKNTAGLNKEELSLIQTLPVVFLLDDYDLINREDFPIIDVWKSARLIIACRTRHMIDERCWSKLGKNISQINLPASDQAFDLEFLLNHEEKRLGINHLFFSIIPEKIFSLQLQPSCWESLDKNAKPSKLYLHNYPYFNFIRELLEVVDEKNAIYRLPDNIYNSLLHQNKKNPTHNSTEFDLVLTENIQNNIQNILVTIREGSRAKPIFAFAPITGDTPQYYRNLSTQLGIHQPFYVLQLSDEGEDRTDDLYQRAIYYASIIQKTYPEGNMILLGWSFGAIEAYATAKMLKNTFKR